MLRKILLCSLLAFCATSQVFATDALTWTACTVEQSGFASNLLNSVVAEGSTIYAGTFGGVSISNDDGQTWKITLPEPVNQIYIGNNVLYAATSTGLYSSDDAGNNWVRYNITDQSTNNELTQISGVYVANDKNHTIYVSGTSGDQTPTGTMFSTDGGLRWTNVFPYPLGSLTSTPYTTAITGTNNGLLIATVESYQVCAGSINYPSSCYYESLDGGQTWQPGLSLVANPSVSYDTFIPSNLFIQGNSVYASGNTQATVGPAAAAISNDGGNTWIDYTTNPFPAAVPFSFRYYLPYFTAGYGSVMAMTGSTQPPPSQSNAEALFVNNGTDYWTEYDSGAGISFVTAVNALYVNSAGSVYVATNSGLAVERLSVNKLNWRLK